MAKFYFTYGTEGQAFAGGWTEIEAPDRNAAYAAFKAFHPCSANGFLPFCACYTEKDFADSGMGKEGNFGRYCHEKIILRREVTPDERYCDNSGYGNRHTGFCGGAV